MGGADGCNAPTMHARRIDCLTAIPRDGFLEASDMSMLTRAYNPPGYNARRACPRDHSFHPQKKTIMWMELCLCLRGFYLVVRNIITMYIPSECCHHFDTVHIDYEAANRRRGNE